MDRNELLKLLYKYRKDIVFEMNTEGYIYENGDTLIYTTFFKYPGISLLLNESAKIIFLSFNGERTLEEVLNHSYEYFDGVSKENFFFDFITILNMLERSGVLYSKKDLERRIIVNDKKARTFKHHYNDIINKYAANV